MLPGPVMRFHYISPSNLPSKAANAVHVMQQCAALAAVGVEVTLYAKRTMADVLELPVALESAYGIDVRDWRLKTCFSQSKRADTLRIAFLALTSIWRNERPDVVLSRNLYASYMLAVLQRRPLLFETHQLEYGYRALMQRAVMTRPWVTTVVISRALAHFLKAHHRVEPRNPLVLHDAAPAGMLPLPSEDRRSVLAMLVPQTAGNWRACCAYFGHLYPGRGVEVIEVMATLLPDVLFLVVGGNEADVAARRARKRAANLIYLGHVPHAMACQIMSAVDALLMPYQASVSIGVAGHDTARWMSPMKMFEYMATGVPILSSALPVLEEVLRHEHNALLVPAANPAAWVAALERLLADPILAARLGAQAHADYLAHYTWDQRARALLAAAPRY